MIFKINVIFHCMGALLDTVQGTVLSRLRRNESITGCYIVKLLETVGAARSELPGRLPLAGITQRTRRTRSRITTRKGAGVLTMKDPSVLTAPKPGLLRSRVRDLCA